MYLRKTKFIMLITSLTLIISTAISHVGTCESTIGNTIYVDDDGEADYTCIQDAIDNASDGDTIYVSNGIYNEKIVIDKRLTLIGIEKPTIDGLTGEYTISIVADSVVIEGFTIINSDSANYTKGVDIKSNDNTISECTIKNTTRSIYLWMSNNNTIKGNFIAGNNISGIDIIRSNNNTVIENKIQSSTNEGIHLWMSDNNNIRDNIIMNNDQRGVYLVSSNNNTILENSINFNKNGIYLQSSNVNVLIGNIVQGNRERGIHLLTSNNNSLKENNITDNNLNGIYMVSSSNNTILGNLIQNNLQAGIHISVLSDNNIIYHNHFIDNTNQAEDECTNSWYNIDLREGNYWSDYTERYPNATQINGVWDTPYNITRGNNKDDYPLLEYYEEEKIEGDNIATETPGFELIFIIIALIFVLLRKQRC